MFHCEGEGGGVPKVYSRKFPIEYSEDTKFFWESLDDFDCLSLTKIEVKILPGKSGKGNVLPASKESKVKLSSEECNQLNRQVSNFDRIIWKNNRV